MGSPSIRHISDKKVPPGLQLLALRILLGLLLFIAILNLGFWSETTDRGRGVTAIRMRLSMEGPTPEADFNIAGMMYITSPPDLSSSPMRLDSTQYRAALRADGPELLSGCNQSSPSDLALVRFNQGDVTIHTLAGVRPILSLKEHSSQDFSRQILQDAFTRGPGDFPLFSPHLFRDFTYHGGELLADNGIGGECRVPAEFILGQRRLELSLMSDSLSNRAAKYQEMVHRSAKRFNVNPDLIYAIMRTESAYNPFAVSAAGALGLMQLVPSTAGGEVHAYLGKSGLPTGSLLFDPENNIQYGSAYLHLLFTRYFPHVRNANSRELCVIAAYNGGPGAVLRVFHPDKDKAIKVINSMSADEVYRKLTKEMPFEESRRYVDKVLSHMRRG